MHPEDIWIFVKTFLEQNGYYILASIGLFYFLRGKYRAYAEEAYAKRTLAEANDPERVAVLRREQERIRRLQQKELYDSRSAHKSGAKKIF